MRPARAVVRPRPASATARRARSRPSRAGWPRARQPELRAALDHEAHREGAVPKPQRRAPGG
eukprot:8594166-Heterocapsa_arctica.AAC.1